MYQGDFRSGFSLRDSPAFDDWQYFQAESLRGQLAAALKRLVENHSQQRAWDAAVASPDLTTTAVWLRVYMPLISK